MTRDPGASRAAAAGLVANDAAALDEDEAARRVGRLEGVGVRADLRHGARLRAGTGLRRPDAAAQPSAPHQNLVRERREDGRRSRAMRALTSALNDGGPAAHAGSRTRARRALGPSARARGAPAASCRCCSCRGRPACGSPPGPRRQASGPPGLSRSSAGSRRGRGVPPKLLLPRAGGFMVLQGADRKVVRQFTPSRAAQCAPELCCSPLPPTSETAIQMGGAGVARNCK